MASLNSRNDLAVIDGAKDAALGALVVRNAVVVAVLVVKAVVNADTASNELATTAKRARQR